MIYQICEKKDVQVLIRYLFEHKDEITPSAIEQMYMNESAVGMRIEHKMEISIVLNEQDELVVSNPVYPKLSAPDTNGTGLANLENRFTLLMNKQIWIESTEETFRVCLPLK